MSDNICTCGHFESEHKYMNEENFACFHENGDPNELTYCICMTFVEDAEATVKAHMKQIEANYDALQSPMPCGHLARYAVNGEDGTQYCALCELEKCNKGLKELIVDLKKIIEDGES